MATHPPGYTSSGSRCCGHIPAVRHMRSAAFLIWVHKVSADNLPFIVGDKYFVSVREPVVQSFFAGQITSQGVRLSGPNHWFQNCPNRIRILRTVSLTNCQHLTLRSAYRPRSATSPPIRRRWNYVVLRLDLLESIDSFGPMSPAPIRFRYTTDLTSPLDKLVQIWHHCPRMDF